jgi:cytochrome c peroxidase
MRPLPRGANAGLAAAVARLEPVKHAHPDVSWADLIAFVGVVAIKHMGGPAVPFSYGRVDEMDPATVTPDGGGSTLAHSADVCVVTTNTSIR